MRRQRQQQTDKRRSSTLLSETIQYVLLIVGVLCISFLMQRFVITSFKVSGSSMYPTLKDGDHVMMYRLTNAKRFDIVVINAPDEAYETDDAGQLKKDLFGNAQRKVYIKRIIGMPGDTLEYKNDTLFINGEMIDEPYLKTLRQQAQHNHQQYMPDSTLETMLLRANQLALKQSTRQTALIQRNGKNVIPDGYYFVLGDNRHNSKDSDEFGLVHASLIQGVTILRFWPFTDITVAPFK